MSDYPRTVTEVLDDNIEFLPATLEAVQAFAAAGPWTGSLEERKAKFRRLNQNLAQTEDIHPPELRFGILDGTSSGGSYYERGEHRITLTGKLSVVTFLHEFAHALGMGEREACRWSINLFRRCFPTQFARLVDRGHMLVRPDDLAGGRV